MGRWNEKRTIDNQWSVTECIDELYELNATLRSDVTKEFTEVNEHLLKFSIILSDTNRKLEQSLKTSSRLKMWLVVLTLVQIYLVLTKLIVDL